MSPNGESKTSLNIAYYITGHGYGHATRVYAILTRMLEQAHSVTIITSAPLSIFKDLLSKYDNCFYRACTCDPGVIQSDAITVDKQKTIQGLRAFLENMNLFEQQEESWMKAWKPSIVVLDVSFSPANVAHKLGIPSIIISNFTLDKIYHAMVNTKEDEIYVRQASEMYTHAIKLLRLPGFISMPSFSERPSKIIDIPLVVRKSRMSPRKVRSLLGIDIATKVVLVSFGGHELFQTGKDGQWTAEMVLPENWKGIIISPGRKFESEVQGLRLIGIQSKDWYLPDIINASDVILSKCGYGMCSETVAHRKPLLYVPRPSFAEEEGLLKNLMLPYGRCLEMPQHDFYAGKWKEYIELAGNMDYSNVKEISLNGDEVACKLVEEICHQLTSEKIK